MNKFEKALDYLRWIGSDGYYKKQREKSFDVLQELVDKAIPKKPTTINGELCCPNCKQSSRLSTYESDCYPEYDNANCGNCGQKIDWSEE